MKLLVLTQKVDAQDDVLGFFHEWLRRLAVRCESVEVICLWEGAHDLPATVRVMSLGKERGAGKIARTLRLYKYLWALRGRYDAVFVHMNPEYLVLAGWWWRFARVRVVLWYAHRQVNLKLRIAAHFADAITSSARTSFQLPTRKLRVLGHGIDTAFFAPVPHGRHEPWRLVSVGRITPIKRLVTLVEALGIVRAAGVNAGVSLVGQAGSAGDRAYEAQLRARIKALHLEPYVEFAGAAPYGTMPGVYHKADVSVNLAPTGGLDKAVLESMACGVPTLASNRGFADYFGPDDARLSFVQDNPRDLADKLVALYHADDTAALGARLRQAAVARAGLDRLIDSLIQLLWPPK